MTTDLRPTDVSVDRHQHGWAVTPVWPGVDRPATTSVVVGDPIVANRLAAAMVDGTWFRSAEVRTDVNGRTYVAAEGQTIGKYVVSGLADLGY